MENREKMIEEMFDDLAMAFIKKMTRVGVDKKEVAKELIKMGYRKVPEGAVVLTQKEYIALNEKGFLHFSERIKLVNNAMEKARKETAREILQSVYNVCKERKTVQWDDLYFLALKYGLEVE